MFNDTPDRDAAHLWHNTPDPDSARRDTDATVIVRNEGDALWSEAAKYRFGQSDSRSGLFRRGRYLINDTQDDIPTYGGIFRGRAKTFQITLTAPTQPGTYGRIGACCRKASSGSASSHQDHRDPAPTAAALATPTNGAAPFTVQFTGQASGGRSTVTLIDTTDDHLGIVTAAGEKQRYQWILGSGD